MVAFVLLSGCLFWLINFYPFENMYPALKMAVANEGFKNLHKIDTDITSTPIILAEDNYNNLLVFTYTSEKTPFGLTKYFINCKINLVSEKMFRPDEIPAFFEQYIPNQDLNYEIDENAYSVIEYFPDICFGLVYSDKRDKILVNGKVPEFYDISFKETDYIFWYAKRDGMKTILSFE